MGKISDKDSYKNMIKATKTTKFFTAKQAQKNQNKNSKKVD